MTPDEARRYTRLIDLYEGDLEEFVKGAGADRIGVGAALNPELAKVAFEIDRIRRKLADNGENMARTIAGMTTEYRHEVQSIADGTWHPLTEWTEGEPDRRPWNVTPTRIVRRYFTDPEVIT